MLKPVSVSARVRYSSGAYIAIVRVGQVKVKASATMSAEEAVRRAAGKFHRFGQTVADLLSPAFEHYSACDGWCTVAGEIDALPAGAGEEA